MVHEKRSAKNGSTSNNQLKKWIHCPIFGTFFFWSKKTWNDTVPFTARPFSCPSFTRSIRHRSICPGYLFGTFFWGNGWVEQSWCFGKSRVKVWFLAVQYRLKAWLWIVVFIQCFGKIMFVWFLRWCVLFPLGWCWLIFVQEMCLFTRKREVVPRNSWKVGIPFPGCPGQKWMVFNGNSWTSLCL